MDSPLLPQNLEISPIPKLCSEQVMKKKYSALCCYFGQWPVYFHFWLTSCKFNPLIDFFLISDIDVSSYNIPDNVILVRMSFQQVRSIIAEKLHQLVGDLDIETALDRPYKLCDFKPAYGYVFEDLFSGYEYWGWYDIDTVWGNIVSFIPPNKTWLKIFPCGHLSFILNRPPFNRVFQMVDSFCCNNTWENVFTTPKSLYFDEHGGIHPLFKRPEFSDGYYRQVDFDNIRPPKWSKRPHFHSINYPGKSHFLCYSFEHGHLFRNYIKGIRPQKEEISYLHISQRIMSVKTNPLADSFVVYPNSFDSWRAFSLMELLKKGSPRLARFLGVRSVSK